MKLHETGFELAFFQGLVQVFFNVFFKSLELVGGSKIEMPHHATSRFVIFRHRHITFHIRIYIVDL